MKYSSATLAKTSRPRAHIVERREAVAAITASNARLIWLVAPPGSGKTSVCIEYTQERAGRAAWLRLDEADRDPASFFHYLEQAIVNGGIADAWHIPQLLPEHLPAPAGYVRLFARSLAAALTANAIIVLDDAYKVQDVSFFADFLNTLSEELPSDARILICSRSAPPAVCAKLLAYGQMNVVDSRSLAFSRKETERLLDSLGLANASEMRDSVFDYSHGWAVGIVLLASWLQRRPKAASQLDGAGVPQLMGNFLANEVFPAYSQPEQEMLLSICWLPYFSADWARELSGIENAEEVLAGLVTGGLIYEYSGRQYSLHRLFRLFLREWAAARIDNEQRLQWIDRSVLLLLSHDDPDAAVELALRYGLSARAAALIENQAAELVGEARHQTLARWIKALPDHLLGPWHHYWLGLALFSTDAARARQALHRAYEAFAASGNQQYRFLALSWIITSYSFSECTEVPLSEILQRHVDSHGAYDRMFDDSLKAHLALSVFSGLTMSEADHPDFELWQQRAQDAVALPIDSTLKLRIITWLAVHSFASGRYRRIAALRAVMDNLSSTTALPSYAANLAHFVRALDATVRADHAGLVDALAVARRCADETGISSLDGFQSLMAAVSQLVQGDVERAGTTLSRAMPAMTSSHFFMAGFVNLLQYWIACRNGNTSFLEFARMMRDSRGANENKLLEILHVTCQCIGAALLEQGDLDARTKELRQLGIATRFPFAIIHADLLDAYRWYRSGREDLALAPLRTGLARLGQESEGYLTAGIPQILQPLCALALHNNIEIATAQSVVGAFRLPPPLDAPDTWPWLLKVRCFGSFELRLGGKPLASRGKSKHRQLELIKLLAAHAPLPLSMNVVAEWLWPDSDGDSAHHALETTLSRLRATVGQNVFTIEHGALSLDRNLCWIDTAILHDRLSFLEKLLDEPEPRVNSEANQLPELYRGDLLFGESAVWLLPRREYWRSRVGRVFGLAAAAIKSRDLSAAARLLERALETNPHSELIAVDLMQIYLEAGLYAEGLAVHQRFKRVAHAVLGAPVSERMEALAQRLQAPS